MYMYHERVHCRTIVTSVMYFLVLYHEVTFTTLFYYTSQAQADLTAMSQHFWKVWHMPTNNCATVHESGVGRMAMSL